MEAKGIANKWTREDFLALLSRGREIKANPNIAQILQLFDSDTTMFNEMKP